MSTNSNSGLFTTCSTLCWLLAFVIGLFVASICIYWLGLHGLVGAVIGLIAMLVLGYILRTAICPAMDARAAATPAPVAPAPEPEPEQVAPATDAAPVMFENAPEYPDDLKVISGVGPALEKTLNELGVYTYEQIGSWTERDIAWVDARLKFKGRIERDDWVKQAKALAKS
jgi:predicted flap endonuclease-1-like 5' DNA nuclease